MFVSLCVCVRVCVFVCVCVFTMLQCDACWYDTFVFFNTLSANHGTLKGISSSVLLLSCV